MGFAVPADAYDRFMGRYSMHLSAQLADLAGVAPGQRVLDVGCGPGALTTELVERLGAASVAAVDPSESFVVAACVWDHAGGRGPLSPLWEAAHALDPNVRDESELPGARHGDLKRLFEAAGLDGVEETALVVRVEHPTFEEWWEPFTLGVGPAGAYVAALDPDRQAALREQCRAALPEAPFVLESQAWTARGLA